MRQVEQEIQPVSGKDEVSETDQFLSDDLLFNQPAQVDSKANEDKVGKLVSSESQPQAVPVNCSKDFMEDYVVSSETIDTTSEDFLREKLATLEILIRTCGSYWNAEDSKVYKDSLDLMKKQIE